MHPSRSRPRAMKRPHETGVPVTCHGSTKCMRFMSAPADKPSPAAQEVRFPRRRGARTVHPPPKNNTNPLHFRLAHLNSVSPPSEAVEVLGPGLHSVTGMLGDTSPDLDLPRAFSSAAPPGVSFRVAAGLPRETGINHSVLLPHARERGALWPPTAAVTETTIWTGVVLSGPRASCWSQGHGGARDGGEATKRETAGGRSKPEERERPLRTDRPAPPPSTCPLD